MSINFFDKKALRVAGAVSGFIGLVVTITTAIAGDNKDDSQGIIAGMLTFLSLYCLYCVVGASYHCYNHCKAPNNEVQESQSLLGSK